MLVASYKDTQKKLTIPLRMSMTLSQNEYNHFVNNFIKVMKASVAIYWGWIGSIFHDVNASPSAHANA